MGNSASTVDQAKLAIDIEEIQKKRKSLTKKRMTPNRSKSGSSKDSKSSKRNSFKDVSAIFDDCEVEDILDLVKALKRDSEGQKLLDEFVDYQTGKSTQKPRLLKLALEDDSNGSDDLPFTEIVIGAGSTEA